MHEMSLAEGIREIVEEAARANGGARVAVVRLAIGRLAPVEPGALRFCFDVVMRGGAAEGARLEIEAVPGRAWCWDCSAAAEVESLAAGCPACGGHRLQVAGGTEMRVREIELAEETATCA